MTKNIATARSGPRKFIDRSQYPKAIVPNDLKPGDVLLHRPLSPQYHQRRISAATNSPFTHASIYLGDGKILHSVPPKVTTEVLAEAIAEDMYTGVLRSQLIFDAQRAGDLKNFAVNLISNQVWYDFSGVAKFSSRHSKHFNDVISAISENWGKYSSKEDFEKQAYLCSALVVACFSYVGIIGESAQPAYPPNVFAPGDLHRDPTFGWFVGYLIPEGHKVPDDDPLLTVTAWSDI